MDRHMDQLDVDSVLGHFFILVSIPISAHARLRPSAIGVSEYGLRGLSSLMLSKKFTNEQSLKYFMPDCLILVEHFVQ